MGTVSPPPRKEKDTKKGKAAVAILAKGNVGLLEKKGTKNNLKELSGALEGGRIATKNYKQRTVRFTGQTLSGTNRKGGRGVG